MSLSQLERRNLIVNFCKQNPTKAKNEVFQHFATMGFKKTTVYRVLKIIEAGKSVNRKTGSGRNTTLSDSRVRARLKAETQGRSAKSYRALARKYGTNHSTIKKYLLKMNIRRRAKKSAPSQTDRQKKVIKKRLKLLSQNFFASQSKYKCVMDDESYFTLEGNEWQQKSYYESVEHPAPESIKLIKKSKFPGKILVWLAISEKGISEPVFFNSGLAVNKEVYITKCLPVLNRFIKKHHQHDEVVFWPDLASAHYAKDTLADLQKRQIEYVPKEYNPPNVPQLRPIENFWAMLKRKVYRNSYQAKTSKNLIVKIKKEMKTIALDGIQRAMREVPMKVRMATKLGVDYFLK